MSVRIWVNGMIQEGRRARGSLRTTVLVRVDRQKGISSRYPKLAAGGSSIRRQIPTRRKKRSIFRRIFSLNLARRTSVSETEAEAESGRRQARARPTPGELANRKREHSADLGTFGESLARRVGNASMLLKLTNLRLTTLDPESTKRIIC